jgi:hypothetical protein
LLDWTLGFIAECAYWLARFHRARADRFIARGRAANAAAETCSRLQNWADGVAGHPFDVEVRP